MIQTVSLLSRAIHAAILGEVGGIIFDDTSCPIRNNKALPINALGENSSHRAQKMRQPEDPGQSRTHSHTACTFAVFRGRCVPSRRES